MFAKLRRVFYCFCGLLVFASASRAQDISPSFDCRKSSTSIERSLCQHDDLAFLDLLLDSAYRQVYERATVAGRRQLLDDQQRWLKSLRPLCDSASEDDVIEDLPAAQISCVSEQYRQRLAVLEPLAVTGEGTWPTAGELNPQSLSVQVHGKRAEARDEPQMVFAQIQSNLERIAAGRETWSASNDKMEKIVDAYAAFLKGDTKAMDEVITRIRPEIDEREHGCIDESFASDDAETARRTAYFSKLRDLHHDQSPLVRLLVSLREVGSILKIEARDRGMENVLYFAAKPKQVNFNGLALIGSFLNLPCRTILGRLVEFQTAQARLGQFAGQLLSCPARGGDLQDLYRVAASPRLFPQATSMPLLLVSKTPQPLVSILQLQQQRKHEAVVAEMAVHPNIAGPILKRDADLSPANKLDYLLFLYAFQAPSEARDTEMDDLIYQVLDYFDALGSENTVISALRATAAPGSDGKTGASNWSTIRRDGVSFYAIPCSVLLAHPDLAEAIEPVYGGTRDYFLPHSGCDGIRGSASGFPDQDFAEFADASPMIITENLAPYFEGTGWASILAERQAIMSRAEFDPRYFLNQPAPKTDYPYEAWRLLSLKNYRASQQVKEIYLRLLPKLALYYRHLDLPMPDAVRAARTALFMTTWDTGKKHFDPTALERRAILAQEPIAEVSALLDGGSEKTPSVSPDMPPPDHLLHISVDYPAALALILKRNVDPDDRNSDGLTPLMVAVKEGSIGGARLLLNAAANPNLAAWMEPSETDPTPNYNADDARTALMYAAANGSLDMIRLLLANDADPYQSDTKGARAIDYLLGFGPVPANGKLSPRERLEAIELLY